MLKDIKNFFKLYKHYLFHKKNYDNYYYSTNLTSCTIPVFSNYRNIWKISYFSLETNKEEIIWCDNPYEFEEVLTILNILKCKYTYKTYEFVMDLN